MGDIHGAVVDENQRWDPSDEDLAEFERGWAEYIQTSSGLGEFPRYSNRYKRQYAGARVGNERAIRVLFLCTYPATWTQTPVGVRDGEPCFFRVIYVVERQTFSSSPPVSTLRPSRLEDSFWGPENWLWSESTPDEPEPEP